MHLKGNNRGIKIPSLAFIYHGIKYILPRAETSQSKSR